MSKQPKQAKTTGKQLTLEALLRVEVDLLRLGDVFEDFLHNLAIPVADIAMWRTRRRQHQGFNPARDGGRTSE